MGDDLLNMNFNDSKAHNDNINLDFSNTGSNQYGQNTNVSYAPPGQESQKGNSQGYNQV